jgi:hypothetical protein
MRAFLAAALILTAGLFGPAQALARPQLLDAVIGSDGVTVTEDDRPVLFYRTRPADPATEPGRLNYVHPLYAPDGTVLTEDRPADHPHQRGLFWSWHQVRLGDRIVADGWFMKGLTFVVKKTRFATDRTGAGKLVLDVDWIVSSGPELVYVATETTTVRVQPLKKGARRIDFATVITPTVDGLSLGGSDDAKGYGGFSMRLIAPDRLVFGSQGKGVVPQVGPVTAGSSMGFAWPSQPGLSKWAVGLSCKVDGKPITQWILRKELSMQNCVWPGRAPVALVMGRPLKLETALVVRPAAK